MNPPYAGGVTSPGGSAGGLVELDEVAAGVVGEGLAAGADGAGVADLDARRPQLRDRLVEVGHEEGEVLAPVGGRGCLDEVDLLRADVEPGAAEPEVGSVGPLHGAEHVD